MDEPEATSTPTSLPLIRGRKGIREGNSVQSPIPAVESRHHYQTRSQTNTFESSSYEKSQISPYNSPKTSPKSVRREKEAVTSNFSSESDDDSSDDIREQYYSDKSRSKTPGSISKNSVSYAQQSDTSFFFPVLCITAILLGLGAYAWCQFVQEKDSAENPSKNLHMLCSFLNLKSQETDFCLNIQVNIKEIVFQDQPKTIMFLYESNTEDLVNTILETVAEFATCHLTKCSNKPVIIEGSSLNNSQTLNDYGKTIADYHESLRTNGVMIVKNLEKVPGVSAQAFHSFCDEFNPVVKKALILFTLKVDKLPEEYSSERFLEKFLLNLWNDIGKDDKFYPLYGRISGTVLQVKSE